MVLAVSHALSFRGVYPGRLQIWPAWELLTLIFGLKIAFSLLRQFNLQTCRELMLRPLK